MGYDEDRQQWERRVNAIAAGSAPQACLGASNLQADQADGVSLTESILQEAHRLTHGERGQAYGPPHEDYGKVAAMFNALVKHKLKVPLSSMDMALAMCCVKLSRQANVPKRDNMVDLAGYAWVVDECAHNG